jgi:hypothetical protein
MTSRFTKLTAPGNDEELRRLYNGHIIMALVHAAYSILSLVFQFENQTRFRLMFGPVWSGPVLLPNSTELMGWASGSSSVHIAETYTTYPMYLIAAFLFINACEHTATVYWWTYYTTRVIDGHGSWFRWAGYSLSASFMNVFIAMASGIVDVFMLLTIGVCTACVMIVGWAIETTRYTLDNAGMNRVSWGLTYVGWLLFSWVWTVIMAVFFHNVSKGAPEWVYAIVVIEFICECMFGVVQLRQLYSTAFDSVSLIKVEWSYLLLSSTAKILLAAITQGGILSYE